MPLPETEVAPAQRHRFTLDGDAAVEHPRERLIATLPLLLSRPGSPAAPVLADVLALAAGRSWFGRHRRLPAPVASLRLSLGAP